MIGCFPLFSRSFPSSKTLQQKGDISCHQPKFTASKTHLFSITGCICSHRFIMSSLQYLQLSTNRWFFAALKTDHILTPKKKNVKKPIRGNLRIGVHQSVPNTFFPNHKHKKGRFIHVLRCPYGKSSTFSSSKGHQRMFSSIK